MAVIKTFHVQSPVPGRCFDWVAKYHEEGEPDDRTLVGHGRNEWDAIRDLIDQDLERAELEAYYDPDHPQEFEYDE